MRQFSLGDDGSLDTVIRCNACGGEERYNFDSHSDECPKANGVGEHEECACYDNFIEWAIEDAGENHECTEGETADA